MKTYEELERENALLRREVTIMEEREQRLHREYRAVRRRLSEWEGSSERIMGNYYHGSKLILPFIDDEEFYRGGAA